MLILTRKVGETLIIGEDEVVVTILAVKGNQVRVGIKAPRHISVHRKEIYQRIQREKITSIEDDQSVDDSEMTEIIIEDDLSQDSEAV